LACGHSRMARSTQLVRGRKEMGNRREFLRLAALGALWPGALAWAQKAKKPEGILVNDLHGQLSATWVNRIVQPDPLDGVSGSLSANMHGRGLTLPPFISDIESFKLLNARGQLVNCSRSENPELFSLAIGGYGLFGVVYSVTLRLVPRRKLERVVEVRTIEGLASAFAD